MKQRCYNPNCKHSELYLGRGIKVCDRWLDSYEAFLEDMGEAPSPKHSIERRDGSGNYEPSNCCWATQKEQTRNTSQNWNITFNGKTQCMAAWADELGISRSIIAARLGKLGWSIEEALSTPKSTKGRRKTHRPDRPICVKCNHSMVKHGRTLSTERYTCSDCNISIILPHSSESQKA